MKLNERPDLQLRVTHYTLRHDHLSVIHPQKQRRPSIARSFMYRTRPYGSHRWSSSCFRRFPANRRPSKGSRTASISAFICRLPRAPRPRGREAWRYCRWCAQPLTRQRCRWKPMKAECKPAAGALTLFVVCWRFADREDDPARRFSGKSSRCFVAIINLGRWCPRSALLAPPAGGGGTQTTSRRFSVDRKRLSEMHYLAPCIMHIHRPPSSIFVVSSTIQQPAVLRQVRDRRPPEGGGVGRNQTRIWLLD